MDLDAFRNGTLPDLIGPGTLLLFVGYNPGLHSVAVQAPFSRRGNRFWPALYRAGILDRIVDAGAGLRAEDRAHVIERGVGVTSLVARATARADELTRAELVAGGDALTARMADDPPVVVAVLGITAYRIAFTRPGAKAGRQTERIGGVTTWVAPNPSGLNAHETIDSLAAAYGAAAEAAGIRLFDRT